MIIIELLKIDNLQSRLRNPDLDISDKLRGAIMSSVNYDRYMNGLDQESDWGKFLQILEDMYVAGSKEWREVRFAFHRHFNPHMGSEEIWMTVHDEEVDALEAMEGRRIIESMDC